MANFNAYELKIFTNLLRKYTGFNFPDGLEQEFSLRLERALDQQGCNLNEFLPKLYNSANHQTALKILSPLLPNLLIGETYFWREPDIFNELIRTILPEIVERKGAFSRLLRVWSAACSTGEEVYSLAITLKHYFSKRDWSWSVMGSDLNEAALEVARKGEYNQYSFRTQPMPYPYCFEPVQDSRRWRVKDEYRTGVRFQKINLAANEYPFPFNDTCNYDLIFCRNIFIYFQTGLSEQIVDRLYESLNDGGYLVVSPCEYSNQLFKRFESIPVGLVTLYRRPLRFWAMLEPFQFQTPLPVTSPWQPQEVMGMSQLSPWSIPEASEAIQLPKSTVTLSPVLPEIPSEIETCTAGYNQLIEQARLALVNNQLKEALCLCQEAIKVDILRPESYLILTGIYQEMQQLDMALEMARKFTYLEPERPEGQFYLASLQQALGRNRRAVQAYKRMGNLLDNYPPQTRFENLPGLSCSELQQLAFESLALLQATEN